MTPEAIKALKSSYAAVLNAELEQHWRAAVTAFIVPMQEGAAAHTALEAERLAGE